MNKTSVAAFKTFRNRKTISAKRKKTGKTGSSAFRLDSDVLRFISMSSRASGLSHDIGKASVDFQGKLRDALSGKTTFHDPVHHSWTSMLIMQRLARGMSWAQAWDDIQSEKAVLDGASAFRSGVSSSADVVAFVAGTHHKLFHSVCATAPPTHGEIVFDALYGHVDERVAFKVRAEGAIPTSQVSELDRLLWSLDNLERGRKLSKHALKGASIFARASTIMADHAVSDARFGSGPHDANALMANTFEGYFYQNLDYHLEQVGRLAKEVAGQMMAYAPDGLSRASLSRIREKSLGRFAWQNDACKVVRQVRAGYSGPTIVFNVATTGAGKTVANVKIATALRSGMRGKDGKVRLTVALNLRSLTLQSGDAIRQVLGLPADELATVIGDRTIVQLHRNGLGEEVVPEAVGPAHPLPAWLLPLSDSNPNLSRILPAPLLVTTIDGIIEAANPGSQSRHVAGLLRVMTSDLIIDELDSYDPKSLGAVMRLIKIAAMCGRNVICSSATLPLPIARLAYQSFESGRRVYSAMCRQNDRPSPAILVHNEVPSRASSGLDFELFYEVFLEEIRQQNVLQTKLAELAVIERPYGVKSLKKACLDGVKRMHVRHAWEMEGKRVSFGLVRVANIRFAIALAHFIAHHYPQARVCAYHANDFLIQRTMKERRLDYLLTRKGGQSQCNDRIRNDPEIQHVVRSSKYEEVPFIVIATPVEEVGRDHDFDWAVIEPSSLQSILQTAGRVNRHRLEIVHTPNISILQFNNRMMENATYRKMNDPCFLQPGLESTSVLYESHNLSRLFQWDTDGCLNMHAGLRFSHDHLFSTEEDRILEERLKDVTSSIDIDSPAWIGTGLYRDFCLRDLDETDRWRIASDLSWQNYVGNGVWSTRRLHDDIDVVERVENDWMSWSIRELAKACVAEGIAIEDGMRFSVYAKEDGVLVYDRSFGFKCE